MDLTRLGQLGKEGVLAMLADSTNVERPGHTRSERGRRRQLRRALQGLQGADHRHHLRLQRGPYPADHQRGRPLRPQGGRHRPQHGKLHAGGHRAGLHRNPPGHFSGHQSHQVPAQGQDLHHHHRQPGGRPCPPSSASPSPPTGRWISRRGIGSSSPPQPSPGNENAVNNIINELYRKKAEVVSENAGALPRLRPRLPGRAENHPRPGPAQVLHPRPRGAAPPPDPRQGGPGDGHPPENIIISDVGRIIELTPNSAQLGGTVPSGRVFVDGYGVGDVGSVVLRDRRHLAQDGMIVVVATLSGETGDLVSGPDIITRGFVYVKESESLMEELRVVALEALETCQARNITDWATIKSAMKSKIPPSSIKTKRDPTPLLFPWNLGTWEPPGPPVWGFGGTRPWRARRSRERQVFFFLQEPAKNKLDFISPPAGGEIPCRKGFTAGTPPTFLSLPPSGRCPSAHTGADEGRGRRSFP